MILDELSHFWDALNPTTKLKFDETSAEMVLVFSGPGTLGGTVWQEASKGCGRGMVCLVMWVAHFKLLQPRLKTSWRRVSSQSWQISTGLWLMHIQASTTTSLPCLVYLPDWAVRFWFWRFPCAIGQAAQSKLAGCWCLWVSASRMKPTKLKCPWFCYHLISP